IASVRRKDQQPKYLRHSCPKKFFALVAAPSSEMRSSTAKRTPQPPYPRTHPSQLSGLICNAVTRVLSTGRFSDRFIPFQDFWGTLWSAGPFGILILCPVKSRHRHCPVVHSVSDGRLFHEAAYAV